MGARWVEFFPSVKLGYVDSKIPPEPPLTKWRGVNEWNFDFERPFPLKVKENLIHGKIHIENELFNLI